MSLRVRSARVAQSVERSAVNRKVAGSNPAMSDIFYFSLRLVSLIHFCKGVEVHAKEYAKREGIVRHPIQVRVSGWRGHSHLQEMEADHKECP